jgi:hypothetical protein
MDRPQPTGPGAITPDGQGVAIDAVATLVHSFAAMVSAMKADLIREMTANADAGKERWQRMEREIQRYQESTDKRIEILESSVHEHHSKEERREIARNAQVQPVRRTFAWLWDHWRDVVLLLIGVFAAATFAAEFVARVLGQGTIGG